MTGSSLFDIQYYILLITRNNISRGKFENCADGRKCLQSQIAITNPQQKHQTILRCPDKVNKILTQWHYNKQTKRENNLLEEVPAFNLN